jgi:GGDEF domain-containing protein
MTDPEARPVSPWLEAAIRAKDPNAFLMGLGETEFAVLLAELDAMRLAVIATRAPGRHRRNVKQERHPSVGARL